MKLDFKCDQGIATKAAIGLIVLQSDETLEPETRHVFDRIGVAVYHSRIPSSHEVTTDTLQTMLDEMPHAAWLLPTSRAMDVVAYCCTSGATVIGPETVKAAIQKVHPKASVTNPLSAVLAACQHLAVNRIGLVSPYIASVSQTIVDKLTEEGLTIPAYGSFEQEEETVVARIDSASVQAAICKVGASDEVEAVFASCTNLRSFDVIENCEAILGKPVITSNQALAWHVLKLAGLSNSGAGPGRLFQS